MKTGRRMPALLLALLLAAVTLAGCRGAGGAGGTGAGGTTAYGAENTQNAGEPAGSGGSVNQQGGAAEGQAGQGSSQSLEEALGITLPLPEDILYTEYDFRGIEERRYVTADPELTEALLDAAAAVRAGAAAEETADDYDEILCFVLTDGSRVPISFNMGNLDTGEKRYRTENDEALRAAVSLLTGEAENWSAEAQDTARLKKLEDPRVLLYGGSYDRRDPAALYLYAFQALPVNYITKKQARKLGWENGDLEDYAPGKSIGGDHFGNYEGILPEDDYRECDIGTLGRRSRGARRIIFTSDYSRIYYTDDHYEHFTLLYGAED